MSKTRGFLLAVAVAAMAFTLSCSSGDGDDGGNEKFSYCVFSGEQSCFEGPYTSSDCNLSGGIPSNSCPYGGGGSSPSVTSSSSGVKPSSSGGSSSSVVGGSSSGGVNLSLDGVWQAGSGGNLVVTISGNTGVITQMNNSNDLWQDAINKNYVSIGGQYFRNLSKTGDLTWTGQMLLVQCYPSSPNVAVSMTWSNRTITMNANGQTFQVFDGSTLAGTYTRYVAPTLDGVWQAGGNNGNGNLVVTISGNTGVITQMNNPNDLWQDAINKNYVSIGGQYFRNLSKTGDLTWTGQMLLVQCYPSSPNVAVSMTWSNRTITMNADGQTFQVFDGSTLAGTYTRQ